jgi:drug/metabolite transporter (DMT)-like permease
LLFLALPSRLAEQTVDTCARRLQIALKSNNNNYLRSSCHAIRFSGYDAGTRSRSDIARFTNRDEKETATGITRFLRMADPNSKAPSRGLVLLAFAALYLIWGSTYLAILYAVETIPPFFTVAARYLMAGLILLVWSLARGEKLPGLRTTGILSLAGVLMLFIGNGAVTWSEQYLPSGLAAVIVATVPLWFVVLDRGQWVHHFSNRWIIAGLLTGFAGVVLLCLAKKTDDAGKGHHVVAYFVVIAGTIGWAMGSLYSKYKPVEASTTMKSGVQMLAGGALALVVGLLSGEAIGFRPAHVSTSSLWALLYLVIMGSVVAYLSYIWLLGIRPAALVGTYAYVNPVVAVLLGWAFVGEELNRWQVLALFIILLGVILVNLAKEKKTTSTTSIE